MGGGTRAVIDVGTNSVKLLVGEVRSRAVLPLLEKSEQTRLGRGFYETHRLQEGPIQHTAQVVQQFAELARQWDTHEITVIATSAARDAVNQQDLVQAIASASGLPLRVITGEEEAALVYKGVSSDSRFAGSSLLVLDVGGGSTEFISGSDDRYLWARSFPLGSVRLLEQLLPSEPPVPEELENCRKFINDFLSRHVQPELDGLLKQKGMQLVGTGGTTTILARVRKGSPSFDREEIESAALTRDMIMSELERFWMMPIEERKQIPGLPPNRADVILMGTAIYAGVMELFGFQSLKVSTRGLRFGALMEA